jgi:cytoskeleton-associated protein 5
MDDNNLAVKLLCLRIIAKIADGMGSPFQAHARLFAGPIANICGDQKLPTRNAAVETLNAIAENCSGIDTMVPGLAASIEKPNPVLRGCVLAFIASVFAKFPPKADLAPLVTSTLASLEDRNGDVRKAAQAVLPFILPSVGYDNVMSQVAKLKPASKSTVTPLVQAAWGSIAATPSASDNKSVSKSAEAKPVGTRLVNKPVLGESNSIPETLAARSISANSVPNTATPPRPKAEPIKARGMQMKNNALRAPGAVSTDALDHRLPAPSRSTAGLSGGLPRPAARRPLPMAEAPALEARSAAPFHTVDVAPKLQREKRDLTKWIYDASNSTGLVEYLQKQMVDHASSEILTLLFSRDRFAEKDHAAGLAIIDQLYSGSEDDTPFDLSAEIAQKIRFANMDLALKYAGIRVYDGSTQMVLKCLDLIQHIVEGMDRARAGFSEAESNVILPAVIYRVSPGVVRSDGDSILISSEM